MIKLGIDALGGDNGEAEVLKAVMSEFKNNLDIKYVIFGNKASIINHFNKLHFDFNNDRIEIINCNENIDMNEHPVFALRSKPDSSIFKAGQALINNQIDLFISAGSSGALVALAQFYLKPINGVDRPVIGAIVPTTKEPMLILDAGSNVDSKPEWLYQYSILANEYYKLMFNNTKPTVALLSVGTEENKGNNLTLEAYKLIKNNSNINFIGNVEARDLTSGICNILITDGFAGNVFLKTYEGTAKLMLELIKSQIKSSIISMLGGLLIKSSIKKLHKKYDAKIYGGAPILGANYLVLKCHGNSMAGEYIYTIRQGYNLVKKDIINSINKNFGD